jgi:putative membrane protein
VTAFDVPVRGGPEEARVPLALLAALAPILVLTFVFTPGGQLNWTLEVGPGLIGIALLAAFFPRFPMSRWSYGCVFAHVLVLTYGGYYTYAKTPLGNWAMAAFDLSRNHYDRVGHLALGFFPAFLIKEILLRKTALRPGGWLFFIVISIALAIGAFWELVEWWAALILDPAGGAKFLGSQGDIWDPHWDMLLALIGSALALITLGRVHERSLRALFARAGKREAAALAETSPRRPVNA